MSNTRSKLQTLALVVALLAVAACSAEEATSDVDERLAEAIDRWSEADVDDYTITYMVTGGIGEVGPKAVEVENGVPLSEQGEGDQTLIQLAPSYSVDDLFDEIESADVILTAEFDPDLGYPTRIDLDPIEGAIDDEFSIEVVGFEQAQSSLEAGVEGPLMRHLAPEVEAGEDAEIDGLLELEDGCLYLTSEDAERYPIVWPNQTRWDEARQSVILGNGDRVAIGERISGGGGYYGIDGVETASGTEAAALTERCVDDGFGETAVLANISDAIQTFS